MATAPLDTWAPALTPAAATRRLAAVEAELRLLEEQARVCLTGADRETALVVAEAVESAARVLAALQLAAARAVDRAAPAPVAALGLVHHQGDGGGARAVSEGSDDCATAGPGGARSPYRRTADLLAARLRIPRREAVRRVRLARQVLPSSSLLDGSELAPPREHVGRVLREVDVAAVAHVLRASDRAAAIGGREQGDDVERFLADQALVFDPDTVGRLADRVLAHLDPDGAAPRDDDPHLTPGVTIGRMRNGLTPIRLVVDAVELETLLTVFEAGTNPRGSVARGGPGTAVDGGAPAALAPDGSPTAPDRDRSRLMLDALLAACAAALRVQALPQTGGMPTQVMVTIPLHSLTGALGAASGARGLDRRSPGGEGLHGAGAGPPTPDVPVLPHAGPVPVHLVRRLACDADLIPVVLGTAGRVLDVGRAHRLFPAWMRQAMVARDGGCTFPGCTVPATWCEAHHLTEWWRGGRTDLADSALLCPSHHHAVHTGEWTCTRTATGLSFTPPWRTTPGLTRNPYHRGA